MFDAYGGWLDPRAFALIRRRAIVWNYAYTLALVLVVGPAFAGLTSPHPDLSLGDLLAGAVGATFGLALAARREGRPWESGTPQSLVLGLAIREQFSVWRAVWAGRPSAEPILRTVETVTVRRVLRRPVMRIGLTVVVAVAVPVVVWLSRGPDLESWGWAVVLVVVLAVQLRNIRSSRAYASRLGVVGSRSLAVWARAGLPPATRGRSRFDRLWSPDGPTHRKWFRRVVLCLGTALVGWAGGIGLLVSADWIQHGAYSVSILILMLGIALVLAGMAAELLAVGSLLAGLWTFVAFRRSAGAR